MAKFIGSDLHTGNWGEDYFIEKLMEYLDDTYVIYRNRPIFGAQFDVVFAPRKACKGKPFFCRGNLHVGGRLIQTDGIMETRHNQMC